jgi:hypothetical protein
MGTPQTPDQSLLRTDTYPAESRDQLIRRRRSAQHAWRTAREHADRAAEHLRDTPAGHITRVAIRDGLESAQLAERAARATYHRVAEETGTLLDRLARLAG